LLSYGAAKLHKIISVASTFCKCAQTKHRPINFWLFCGWRRKYI